jgi:hypothetical protein
VPADPPPREAAWSLLATGLHVHRWFLLVQPVLDRREREAVERWPSSAVARLCGRPVAVAGGARIGQDRLDAASAMLEAAGLAQVVQLGVQVIVVGDGAGIAAGPRAAVVTPAPPADLAEQLLAAAARTWVTLLLDPEVSRPPAVPPHPGAEEEAVEGYALSLRCHLLTRLAQPGPWPEAVAAAARERLPEVRARAARFAEVVHDLAASLGRLALGDLLTLTCPGPRQFEKYRSGKVAGQA